MWIQTNWPNYADTDKAANHRLYRQTGMSTLKTKRKYPRVYYVFHNQGIMPN